MTIEQIDRDENSRLEVVGLRVDADVADSQFYILYDVDTCRPLDHNGYPVVFFSPSKHREALDISTCLREQLPFDPDSLITPVCMDIAMAIHDIGTLDKATNTNIVSELNILLDFIAFLSDGRINMRYKKIMETAADHFTFRRDIEGLFQAVDFSRIELIQAIEWAVGATVLHAKYVY